MPRFYQPSCLTHRSSDDSTGVVTTAGLDQCDPAPRQLTEQGRERKQQLIDVAVGLFSQRGYHATRVRDICEQAGVAKGLFYWYFPTKLDLFAELVRTMRQRLRRAQGEAMQADDAAIDRIRQGTVASVLFMAEHAAYFSLVEVERGDRAIGDTLRDGSDVYLTDVTALVREAQRDGSVPDCDPGLLALGVLGAVSSYSNAWRSGRIDLDPPQLAEFVADWVVRALT